MSQDYTYTKSTVGQAGGTNYPPHARDSAWQRLGPLITPDELRREHLFGIPLVSAVRDPVSGEYMRLTDTDLARIIARAVIRVEEDTHLAIMPTQMEERLPFEHVQYENMGYMRLTYRPVASVESVDIGMPNDVTIFHVPLDWVDTAGLDKGQINLVPTVVANDASGQAVTGNGISLLVWLCNKAWVPSYWRVRYTTGFVDGLLPGIVNDLVGTVAAMMALSRLAATDAGTTSASLGMDGISQSSGGPGPNKYGPRMKELADDRTMYTNKLRVKYGTRFFTGTV